ncbi:sporulation protein [Pseudoluteimonas lycopersici]|uniref:Sporulation protein n=1 Tax=Pseudoluteimonas lycopersici TaxID=1324796 RepID=A0A516V1M7_9GAMM|nr:SPOR domain-containing protein [Lysobacter lycopersici]QDQ72426.1 sporulation protein [Lysobacter lycopersici]
MDTSLKQRLWGAAVLIALAVIFLPMLVQGPAPDSGAADVPLNMPATPDTGMETRELPLAGPVDAPAGGATGMPVNDDAANPADSQDFPATTAGGDYAVHFGSYASADAAQSMVAALAKSQLAAYSEAVQLNGKPAWRVRIGPFATQADAEAARLRATQVRSDVNARVVVLDAETASPAPAPAATAPIADTSKPAATPLPPEPKPVATKPAPATSPATAKTETPKQRPMAPAPPAAKPMPTPAPAAANVGFVVQLAAFAKPADAEALRDRARAAGFSAFTESVKTDKGTLTRVRIGPVADRAAADQLKTQVQAKLGVAGIVRPHP